MIKKFQLGKDILSLIIFTLFTVLTWVTFEVWVSATKSTIPKTTKEQMAALNPKISKEILEFLKTKITLSEEELNKSDINIPEASTAAEITAETTEGENPINEDNSRETEINEINDATESSQKATESGILE